MLKISHISKTFNPGTVNEKKAIEDLSLELKQGILQRSLAPMALESPRYSMQSAEIS